MTNAATKFKERSPEETVAILRDFFIKKGFETECFSESSDVGTFYCKVNLYFDGRLVLDTNGKGLTEVYSMASGYAELYERFCNQINWIYSPYWCVEIMEKSKEEFGYFFDPDEHVISDEDAVRSPEYAQFFESMFRTDEQRKRALRIMLGTSQVTEIPYTDFVTGERVYMDPRLLLRLDRSKGCAAGNTPIEAFNQSLSELLEAEVETKVMMGELHRFTRVSDKYLSGFPDLYGVIRRIREQGNELYILDFGYETGFPVLASVLVQKDTASVFVNFGCFPVFEIALERVLTELYQGKRSCRGLQKPMRPWHEWEKYRIITEGANNITSAGAYPSGMYLDLEVADEPSQCFLNSMVEGNEAIFSYFQNLCREKGISVCWRDTSLSKDMSAVRVFIRGLKSFRDKGGSYQNASSIFVQRQIGKLESYIDLCMELMSGRQNTNRMLEASKTFNDGIDGLYAGTILNGEYLDFTFTKVSVLTFAFQDILEGRMCTPDAEQAIGKPAALLRIFHTFDPETSEKIIRLCGGEFELDRMCDPDYILKKVVVEPLMDHFAFMHRMAAQYFMCNF